MSSRHITTTIAQSERPLPRLAPESAKGKGHFCQVSHQREKWTGGRLLSIYVCYASQARSLFMTQALLNCRLLDSPRLLY